MAGILTVIKIMAKKNHEIQTMLCSGGLASLSLRQITDRISRSPLDYINADLFKRLKMAFLARFAQFICALLLNKNRKDFRLKYIIK